MSSISKVGEKSDEELNKLLAKIEAQIVGSITQGIELVDTARANLGGASGSIRDFGAAKKAETHTDKIELEDNKEGTQFVVPDYSGSIDINKTKVRISSPIILVEITWPELKVRADGIYLEKGFYKIEYTFNNVGSYHGIGLFDTDKNFKQLLAYHRAVTLPEPILYQNGHFYLEIKKVGVVAITDGSGRYRPRSFRGLISITVHKFKTTPE